jgi:5-methyltetrahydrofolate--homocysteine methyltransferase
VLLYKSDWGKARELFAAWWEGEVKQPLLQVVAPKGVPVPYDGWDFCRYPDQPELAVRKFEEWCNQMFFGGLAYPNLWVNFGPGILSAFLGAEPVFTGQTMWFGNQRGKGPLSLREIAEAELDLGNIWWRRVENATRVAISLHRGKFVVGMTDIGGVLDVIAALRGTVEVLKDMVRDPEGLKSAIWNVTELWHECYDRLYRVMVEGGHDGTSAWMGLWSPRRWYPLQCDIAFTLSPQRFEEFVVPHLREQCERLDHPVYHWDGPGQIPHLPHLLKLDFAAIQWVPGAQEELSGHDCGSPKWYDLYRKVLEAGKGLILSMPPWRVEGFVRAFPRARVIVQTWAGSVEEAKKMLELLHWDELFPNAVVADQE